MKYIDIFKLSVINIIRNPKCSLKLMTLFFFNSLIWGIVLIYSITLRDELKEIVNLKMSQCNNLIYTDFNSAQNIISGINEYYLASELDLLKSEYTGVEEKKKVYLDFADLEVMGKKYKGINDFSFDFYSTSANNKYENAVPLKIGVMESGSTLMSKSELKEYECRFGKTPWLNGDMPNESHDLIISDYMLEKFGINKEFQDQFIGKNINLYLSMNNAHSTILNKYKITGIIDSDIFYLHGKKYSPQIFILYNEATINSCANLFELKIFYDDFKKASLKRSHYIQKNLQLSDNETIKLFNAISIQQSLVVRISVILCIMEFIAINIVVFSILENIINRKKRIYQMLIYMGTNTRDLRKQFFYEIIILSIPFIICGGFVSILASQYLINSLSNIIGAFICIKKNIGLTINLLIITFSIMWITVISLYETKLVLKVINGSFINDE